MSGQRLMVELTTASLLNMSSSEMMMTTTTTKPPGGARRCLFGRPDPEKQSQYFEKQEQICGFQEDARRFRDTWGMDPVTGAVVEGGKFEFEIVQVKDGVPSFYTKMYFNNHISRKPRPVAPRAVRAFSTVNDFNRSAKRKLDLQCEENDENEVVDKRVPSQGEVVSVQQQQQQQQPPAPLSGFKDNVLFDSGFIGYSTASSIPVLSPASRNSDILTPPSRARSLLQMSMKDYLPNKKQRLLNKKSLPRT